MCQPGESKLETAMHVPEGIDTQCPFCSVQCKMTVHAGEETLAGVVRAVHRAEGKPNAASQGRLCVKGMNAHQHALHAERLLRPLMRKAGRLVPVTWKEALDAVAETGEPVKEGICGCTTLDRDAIIDGIREMGLKSVKEVMYVLGWNEPEGCSKCRPALNYYLGMLWPLDYVDEKESRFTNERYHANIQKDGTYSVVPRIYGGVTSPADLKKIAAVAEKYNVPLVKFTGGQRLDLLGVKKEDLPGIWSELDMPSGHAYGKTLRTVKTCVGNTFCRFGTQDAMGMGIRLEKAFERLNAPSKVKLAVSGCPRNCAEATIKDLGVVAIDGGWGIYVGGNGGIKVRAAELLCTVKTEDEVMEWTGAYLQYYREQANWNERTAHWVERVGLESIKQALANDETRKQLVGRIEETLSTATDPWREIIEDREQLKNFVQLPELIQ